LAGRGEGMEHDRDARRRPSAAARWSAVASDAWSAPYEISGWSSRTTVVRLATGGLLAINPGLPLAATAKADLQAIGNVEYLMAPNHYHHLGLAAWRQVFGPIPVVACAAAQPRLRARGHAPLCEPGAIEPLLPDNAKVLLPPGTRTGEAWLRLDIGGQAGWIVGDAFFHVPRTPRNAAGLFLRLSGTTAGLRIGATFKWGHLRDRRVYREWVGRLLDGDPPTTLIPAHGDVLTDADLARRVRRLLDDRL
jgi:hypothetical protein